MLADKARKLLHWRKVRIVREAAGRLPEHDIAWAVIAPRHADPDVPGWDYHLIRRTWGIGTARRIRIQQGGWILAL